MDKKDRIVCRLTEREAQWIMGIVMTFLHFDSIGKKGMTPEGRMVATSVQKKLEKGLSNHEDKNTKKTQRKI